MNLLALYLASYCALWPQFRSWKGGINQDRTEEQSKFSMMSLEKRGKLTLPPVIHEPVPSQTLSYAGSRQGDTCSAKYDQHTAWDSIKLFISGSSFRRAIGVEMVILFFLLEMMYVRRIEKRHTLISRTSLLRSSIVHHVFSHNTIRSIRAYYLWKFYEICSGRRKRVAPLTTSPVKRSPEDVITMGDSSRPVSREVTVVL